MQAEKRTFFTPSCLGPVLHVIALDVIDTKAMVGNGKHFIHQLQVVDVDQVITHHQHTRGVVKRIEKLLVIMDVILITYISDDIAVFCFLLPTR